MKRFFLALLIAVLSCFVCIPLAFLCFDFEYSALILMLFFVFVDSYATMIILKRNKENYEALDERLDEIEKQIKNKDKTN